MFYRILTFLILFLPNLALAQANLFEPVPNDKSMLLLAAIFGKLEIFGPSGNDPFAAGIQAFNGAVLIIGGILVSYTIVAGTLGTAHDGEMLGKKFSSVWVPIRTALGTALVLPVINGTYCVMQAIVGWLIVQGIGLADNVWKTYTDAENLNALVSAGNQNIGAKSFGYGIFQSKVCVAAMNKAIDDIKAKGNGSVLPMAGAVAATMKKEVIVNPETMATSDKLSFGLFSNGDTTPIANWDCGSAIIPKTPGNNVTTLSSSVAAVMHVADAHDRAIAVTTAQYDAANTMVSTMETLANNLVNNGTVNTAQIDAAISTYEKAVQDSASAQIASLQTFATLGENASKDGWLLAGAFYTKIAFMTDLVQRSMSSVGSASGPQSVDNSLINDVLAPYAKVLRDTLSKSPAAPISAGFGISDQNNTDKGWEAIILNKDFDAAMKKMFSFPKFNVQDGEHPLMAMKRLGNSLLTGVSTTLGITVVGLFIIGGLSNVVGFLLSLTTLGFLMPIIASAIILSYLLPMLPFFLWFGATIGWVIMCIESILAAPMWAIMHLSPHGDDMVGTGSQGYKLVLSLILRPVLMVFGLIASFVGITVIGGFFNEIFFDVFVLNQQDTSFITWIVGMIVAPLMYAIGMFVLIKKLFSMIYIIPDEMLKWFGGGGPQLGNFANTIGGEQGGMAIAAGMIGNTAGNALGSMANKGSEKMKEAGQATDLIKGSGGNESAMSSVKGLSAFGQAKFGKQANEALKSVGGPGSEGGNQLMEKFNELSANNPDKSPEENLKAAQEHYNENNFGPESKQLVDTISNGDYGGASYNRLMGSLHAKQAKLVRGGMSEFQAKEAVKGIVKNTVDKFNALPANEQTRSKLGSMLAQTSSEVKPPDDIMPQVSGGKEPEANKEVHSGNDVSVDGDTGTEVAQNSDPQQLDLFDANAGKGNSDPQQLDLFDANDSNTGSERGAPPAI